MFVNIVSYFVRLSEVFCDTSIMNFGNLQNMLAQHQQNQGAAVVEAPVLDTSEKVTISSLALLKMLKHGISCFVL